MQRHEVTNSAMLCELHRELDSVLEAHARHAPRALRCALKLALRETFAELQAHAEDPEIVPEQVLEAFIEEVAFELALHVERINAGELSRALSSRIAARLAPPAAAA